MHRRLLFVCLTTFLLSAVSASIVSSLCSQETVDDIRAAMAASIRTSWEQGTAAGGVLEYDYPRYTVFGDSPFKSCGPRPTSALQYGISAVVRQDPDGRLSQLINDALDGAALDGASAGSVVLLGFLTDPARSDMYLTAANAQLNYLLYVAPRTASGAISMRSNLKQYWSDGVYMSAPFLAYYGAVFENKTILQQAFDQVRLYRDALIQDGPTGPLWAHIYDEDNSTWVDQGLWSTGNAWAALGMIRVAATFKKSSYSSEFTAQIHDLAVWTKEILDGTFAGRRSDNLMPNYIYGGETWADASSSAALASVAYRAADLFPKMFGSNYTETAEQIRDAVINNLNNMGMLSPVVNPVDWHGIGILSTEAQSFGLMMLAAWRDWYEDRP